MSEFKNLYFNNHLELSLALSSFLINHISLNSKTHIGIATGFSPLLCYQLMAKQIQESPSLSSKIFITQLDEWYDVSPESEASCQYYIRKNIIEPWKLINKQCQLIEGQSKNHGGQLKKLNQHIADHPLDICLLGLGQNGHIALNEPRSKMDSDFRIVDLSMTSQQHEMLNTTDYDTNKGITIGISDILNSKKIILIVSGQNKRSAFINYKNLISAHSCPAVFLQSHKDQVNYIDESIL